MVSKYATGCLPGGKSPSEKGVSQVYSWGKPEKKQQLYVYLSVIAQKNQKFCSFPEKYHFGNKPAQNLTSFEELCVKGEYK